MAGSRQLDLFGAVDAPPRPASGDAAVILEALQAWVDAGWLRPLDRAFAHFVSQLAPDSAPATVLACALLAHMEGRGHSCLDLEALLADRQAVLAWPLPAAEALDALMAPLPADWRVWAALLAANVAVLPEAQPDANQPLVLSGTRLYLRRYWLYERTVARRIGARAAQAEDAQAHGTQPHSTQPHDTQPHSPQPHRTQPHGVIDETAVRHWLDRLFDDAAPVVEAPPTADACPNWQKIACAVALRARLAIITGGPGTGKTYTVARLLALLFATAPDPARLRVALAAPTGKAAARLKQSIDSALADLQAKVGDSLPLYELAERIGAARTLHALLGSRPDTRHLRFHAGHPLDIDVLIVDEASMIHLEMMAAVLDALPPHARLVLLGDKDQLASVEAGSVLGDLCRDAAQGKYQAATRAYVGRTTGETIPERFLADGNSLAQRTVMLRESRRFGGPIGQLALAVNAGDGRACRRILDARDDALRWVATQRAADIVGLCVGGHGDAAAIGASYRPYLEALAREPDTADIDAHGAWVRQVLAAFDGLRVLCALREGDWGAVSLNRAIEAGLHEAGLIRKRGEWYAGRPVMVTRNDYGVGVFNGDIGIALPAPRVTGGRDAAGRASATGRTGGSGALRVYFADGDALRSVLPTRLPDIETAFAMTVHKAQGSEFGHTVLVLPDLHHQLLTSELIYTGITRARTRFTLVCAQRAVFEAAVERRTRRASGLYERLQAF